MSIFDTAKVTDNTLFDDFSSYEIAAAKLKGTISAKILNARKSMHMSQKDFAQFMCVTQGMVSKWESADYNFSIESLATVFEKLNLKLEITVDNITISSEQSSGNICDNYKKAKIIDWSCSNGKGSKETEGTKGAA